MTHYHRRTPTGLAITCDGVTKPIRDRDLFGPDPRCPVCAAALDLSREKTCTTDNAVAILSRDDVALACEGSSDETSYPLPT